MQLDYFIVLNSEFKRIWSFVFVNFLSMWRKNTRQIIISKIIPPLAFLTAKITVKGRSLLEDNFHQFKMYFKYFRNKSKLKITY